MSASTSATFTDALATMSDSSIGENGKELFETQRVTLLSLCLSVSSVCLCVSVCVCLCVCVSVSVSVSCHDGGSISVLLYLISYILL